MMTADELLNDDMDIAVAALRGELDQMAGGTLLVTGGAGFLGYSFAHLVRHWNRANAAERRIDLTIYDNFVRGRPEWLNIEAGGDVALETIDMIQPLPEPIPDSSGSSTPRASRRRRTIGESDRDHRCQHQRPAQPARRRASTERDGPAAQRLPVLLLERDLRRPAPDEIPTPETTAATSRAPGRAPATTSRSATARRCASTSPSSTACRSRWRGLSTTTARG